MIYARYKDKKDLEKLVVTPLPDNHESDHYYYQILLFTGQRKDEGTKSKVHFILSGDKNETYIRTFANPHRTIFQRDGIDAFIIAVPKSLGLLQYIRIWHDNSDEGSSSSWFFKYLIIRDLQTMEKFHFISQKWFAVEIDDGKIERLIPVANEIEKKQFSSVLSIRACHSVSDGHLWFSIFSLPPSNQFTRVQRFTCCFVLFYVSMFLNIMYYDLSNEVKTMNDTLSLSLGPIYISSEQIVVDVVVELLTLIPSILLVQFFRRIRSRRYSISPLHNALSNISPVHLKINVKKNKSGLSFPWWCLFIAYGFCAILIGLSIVFIIARGIEFGDLKCQQWLTSILTGFFSSILFTQSLKILSLAIFFPFFCQNTDDDKEANEYLDDSLIDFDYLYLDDISIFTYRPSSRANRLTEGEIAYARQQRLKEIHMWSILEEIFVYLCLIILLCIITYSNRESNSYLQVNHLRKYLLNSNQIDYDYTKISTIDEYWNWLEESFIFNIHAQSWYNGDSPRNLSGFINDKTNRLIGWPMMRKLRIKSDLCLNIECKNIESRYVEMRKG